MKTGPKPKPMDERLWPKVTMGPGCWEWQGAILPNGYGYFYVNEVGRNMYAHRVVYERRGEPAQRTHCPRGHPYDERNTHRDARNKRHCRACDRDRQRQRRKSNKAVAA